MGKHLLFSYNLRHCSYSRPFVVFHRKTLKGAWDFGSFLSENGSILIGGNSVGLSPTGGERHHNGSAMTPGNSQPDNSKPDCQAARSSGNMAERFLHTCGAGVNVGSMVPAAQRHVISAPSSFPPLTRALWAGVKTSEGNHYTITHAQPFDQKLQRSSLPSSAIPSDPQPDEDSAGYTTLHPSATTSVNASSPCTNAENKMYYCCTDLILIQQPSSPVAVQQVTSLDDSTDMTFEASQNPLYVNMSPLHPLSSPKLNYPLVNPVYPSPCRPQQLRIVGSQTIGASIINNQFIHHHHDRMNSALHYIPTHNMGTRQHVSQA